MAEPAAVNYFPDQPNQPEDIDFPRREFGNTHRSFQRKWFKQWKWLHYDVERDESFCFLCLKYIQSNDNFIKYKYSKKRLVTKGYYNWKYATKQYRIHEKSDLHLLASREHELQSSDAKSQANFVSEPYEDMSKYWPVDMYLEEEQDMSKINQDGNMSSEYYQNHQLQLMPQNEGQMYSPINVGYNMYFPQAMPQYYAGQSSIPTHTPQAMQQHGAQLCSFNDASYEVHSPETMQQYQEPSCSPYTVAYDVNNPVQYPTGGYISVGVNQGFGLAQSVDTSNLHISSEIVMNILIIGDSGCGKSSLLMAFKRKQGYSSTENQYIPLELDGSQVNLFVSSISGYEDDKQSYEEYYPKVDVVAMVFSIINPSSLKNILFRWRKEVDDLCPEASKVLIGCQLDLQKNGEIVDKLVDQIEWPVYNDFGCAVAKYIGAFQYVECSAMLKTGITQVFEAAARAHFGKLMNFL